MYINNNLSDQTIEYTASENKDIFLLIDNMFKMYIN